MTAAAAPIRTGLVGFGRLAELHYAPALARIPAAHIMAIAEPLPERQRCARAAFPSAEIHDGLDALLSGRALDALLVATPPAAHLRALELASATGLPVFVEKPLVGPDQLHAFTQVPALMPLMIDFNRRFWPAYRELRARLGEARRGAPVNLRIVLHVDPQPWRSVTPHREKAAEGGLLYDLGSQALDLASFFCGSECRQVCARSSPGERRMVLETTFADGSSAVCDISYTARAAELVTARAGDEHWTMLHPMLGIRCGDAWAPNLSGDFAAVAGHVMRGRFSMIRATVTAALAHFFSSIVAGRPFEPGRDAAIVNARALEAASRSLLAGRAVDV